MQQGGRASRRPGMLWLDLDHGQLNLLDLDYGGAELHGCIMRDRSNSGKKMGKFANTTGKKSPGWYCFILRDLAIFLYFVKFH